jgi:hypothetical protein
MGESTTVDFSVALDALKEGARVTRDEWYSQYVELQEPDPDSKMTYPYFYMGNLTNEDLFPYTFTTFDLLAEDWMIL